MISICSSVFWVASSFIEYSEEFSESSIVQLNIVI